MAEIVEHLSIVEGRVARLLSKLVEKLEATSPREDGSEFAPVSLAEFVERARVEKYQAPEEIRPKGAALSDSLASLRESRAALRALAPRAERVEGTLARFPHPVWGPLDLYQWLAFVGAHEQRHIAQIDALKKAMSAASQV